MDKQFIKNWLDALERHRESEKRGIISGVEISKPAPWKHASTIIELNEHGLELKEIAKKTGFSIPTVKRAIETKGEDIRTGPQCEKHAGRVFSVAEAIREMPLPCGENCVCMWVPVFKE
jgi:hypothetical protein